MSVLKCRRGVSATEYVYTAYKIYKEVLDFVTRLSARYERILAPDAVRLASEVVDNAEKAHSVFPNDSVRKELRERYLLNARASVLALDVHMAIIYETCMMNPQGCFTRPNGKTLTSSEAIRKLDNMSISLGEKIDSEETLLTGVLESDKKRS